MLIDTDDFSGLGKLLGIIVLLGTTWWGAYGYASSQHSALHNELSGKREQLSKLVNDRKTAIDAALIAMNQNASKSDLVKKYDEMRVCVNAFNASYPRLVLELQPKVGTKIVNDLESLQLAITKLQSKVDQDYRFYDQENKKLLSYLNVPIRSSDIINPVTAETLHSQFDIQFVTYVKHVRKHKNNVRGARNARKHKKLNKGSPLTLKFPHSFSSLHNENASLLIKWNDLMRQMDETFYMIYPKPSFWNPWTWKAYF